MICQKFLQVSGILNTDILITRSFWAHHPHAMCQIQQFLTHVAHVSCAKTDEPMNTTPGQQTPVDPRNFVLDGGTDPMHGKGHF